VAVTKIWAVRSRLDHLVEYVSNVDKILNPGFDDLKSVIKYAGEEHKTEQRFFATGINCQPETAYKAMSDSLKLNDKKIKVLAYHGYQSFAKGEVTAKTAHEIGVKMAQELWGTQFQVIVATHLNTDHFHNHFVLCSTSFLDGKRFHACKESYAKMREVSDRLCREYELSVIEKPNRSQTKHYTEWQAEQENRPTLRGLLKAEIDEAISQSMTENQFVMNLQKRGFEVKLGKHIAIRPPGSDSNSRFIRLHTKLGEAYSRQNIIEQMRGRRPIFPDPPPKRVVKKVNFKGNIKTAKKLTGFRALYFHYLYLLGKIPKKRQKPPSKVHFLFREDLIKIDKISNEIKLLCHNRIDTSEQLLSYKAGLTERIETLTAERTELRKQLRRVKDDSSELKQELKSKISILSKGLGELRKEVRLCDDIADRTEQIKEKKQKIREQGNQQNINKAERLYQSGKSALRTHSAFER